MSHKFLSDAYAKGAAEAQAELQKTANPELLAALGLGGLAAGLGATSGYLADVKNKVVAARQGENYKPESFIQRHPMLTGALSLGIAPAMSAQTYQQELDADNSKVRRVMKDHPIIRGLGGIA